ncbi:hypothetical protein BGP79_05205 [Tersicoccus sp. Bi-70]|nr:LysR substrate-binding domain-containing protein [Tersicoccus sp. Bi-70]OMH34484.1 hypothetical protein BGP79_05205 [Tersicoccus sp. Bi-70]
MSDLRVLSTLAVRDDLALGRLVQVHIADARLARPLTAVWHPDRSPSGAAALLLNTARSTATR